MNDRDNNGDTPIDLLIQWVQNHENETLELHGDITLDGIDILMIVESDIDQQSWAHWCSLDDRLEQLGDHLLNNPDADIADIADIINIWEYKMVNGEQVPHIESGVLVGVRTSVLTQPAFLDDSIGDNNSFIDYDSESEYVTPSGEIILKH